MSMKQALEAIGGLSAPAKMPCHCWSINARDCNTGGKLRGVPGSTCEHCYAMGGCYGYPATQAAMARRFDKLTTALSGASIRFSQDFAEVLNAKMVSTCKRLDQGKVVRRDGRYFRWFDSGDLQSLNHLYLIADIAERCPEIEFWLPTREKGIVKAFTRDNRIPFNLVIRLSLPMIDKGPTAGVQAWADSIPGLTLSAVHHRQPAFGQTCVAPKQDGECRDCRACWDRKIDTISYHLH